MAHPTFIIAAVGRAFGVTYEDLVGPRGSRNIVKPRSAAAHLLRGQGLTYKEVGDLLGGRDHSTIQSSVRAFDRFCEEDTSFASQAAALAEMVAADQVPQVLCNEVPVVVCVAVGPSGRHVVMDATDRDLLAVRGEALQALGEPGLVSWLRSQVPVPLPGVPRGHVGVPDVR